MAIGDVRSQVGTARAPVSMGQNMTAAGRMGRGIGEAITTLAGAVLQNDNAAQDLRLMQQERDKKKNGFEVEKRWIEYNTQSAKRFEELKRVAPPDGSGFTNQVEGLLTQEEQEFLAATPKEWQEEYKVLFAKKRGQSLLDAYSFEIARGDAQAEQDVKQSLTSLGGSLMSGAVDQDGAQEQLEVLIDKSTLPEAKKEELKLWGEQSFASLEFNRQYTQATTGRGTVNPPTGEDVVAAGLDPIARTMLNIISGPESGGKYNVRYSPEGAQTFSDFSKHPEIFEQGPDGPSSAAGRYQFTATTWKEAVALAAAQGVMITDFSEESQDRVGAIWLPHIYKKRSGGRDIYSDLASRDFDTIANVRKVLIPEWRGLANINDLDFVAQVNGGVEKGGTPPVGLPDPWTDARFASISLDEKLKMASSVNSALAAQGQQRVAATSAQAAARETALYEGAYNGTYTYDQIPAMKAAGIITSVDDEKELRRGIAEFEAKVAASTEVAATIATGGVLTGEDSASVDNWFSGMNGPQSYAAMDADAASALNAQVAQGVGYLPDTMQSTLSRMLNSGSIQEKAFAMEQLSSMQSMNPNILEGTDLDRLHGAKVDLFGLLAPMTASSTEAYQLVATAQEIHKGKTPAAVKGEAQELFAADGVLSDPVKLANRLPSTGFLVRALPGYNSAFGAEAEARFSAEAMEAYAAGYAITGNADAASAYTVRKLSATWGPSETNGGKMMKYAPEALYPKRNGDHSWMREQLHSDLGIPKDFPVDLVADEQTAQEYDDYVHRRSADMPSYKAIVTMPNGELVYHQRWYGDPKETERANQADGSRDILGALQSKLIRAEFDAEHFAGELYAPDNAKLRQARSDVEAIKKQIEELQKGQANANP